MDTNTTLADFPNIDRKDGGFANDLRAWTQVPGMPLALWQLLNNVILDVERREEDRQKDSPQQYWEQVRGIAQEVFDENPGSDADDEDYDKIHEQVDGSYWIIYYHAAERVMNLGSSGYTSHEDAWEDLGAESVFAKEGRGKGATPPTLSTIITRMAYSAMAADVSEALAELREAYEEPDEDEDEDEDDTDDDTVNVPEDEVPEVAGVPPVDHRTDESGDYDPYNPPGHEGE